MSVIGIRSPELMRRLGPARHRFHDAVLAATAQVHGHGLLTKREPVFGAWTQVKVAPP
jgi:hypothetical protein